MQVVVEGKSTVSHAAISMVTKQLLVQKTDQRSLNQEDSTIALTFKFKIIIIGLISNQLSK